MSLLLSRKEREKLSRRHAMLEAAAAVFAEKGFDAASIDEIAQRAEFGKGTLYLYFPQGKEEMLREIISSIFEKEYEVTQKLWEDVHAVYPTFRSRLEAYYENMISFYHQHRDLFRLIMKEVNRMFMGDDAEKAAFVREKRARVLELLVPQVQKAIEKKELNPNDPTLLAHMIMGNLHGFMMYDAYLCAPNKAAQPPNFVTASTDAAKRICAIVCDGIGRGIAPT